MTRSVSIDIAAPPARVWAVLSEVARWPEWTPTVTSVRRADEGALAVGSRATVEQPRLADAEYVVTDLTPGRAFTWVATRPGLVTTATHEVEPLPAGGARVHLAVAQSGALGAIMGRLYRGLTDRYLANEANGLKARCETGASAG
ncbi:SRPBCC family protein [Demequina maris]|uniref:SRPBCC family protein n=1 Tax=Demequina maris TaxID=1638982 RepID=UPI0007835CE8|nr:SRPBCC family protein [Demequina maris]